MVDAENTFPTNLADIAAHEHTLLHPSSERDINTLAKNIVRNSPEELYELWNIQQFEKGKEIFSTGSPNDSFYVLLEGRARVVKTTGDKKSTLWLPKPGAVIGSDFFSDDKTHPCSALAIEDSEVMVISRTLINQLRESESNQHTQAFCQMILQATGNALDQIADAAEIVTFMTVRQRLAQHLLELSHAFEKKPQAIEATHQWIADNLGIWRETVSKGIEYFVQRGLISMSRGKIQINDPASLLMEMLTPAQHTNRFTKSKPQTEIFQLCSYNVKSGKSFLRNVNHKR